MIGAVTSAARNAYATATTSAGTSKANTSTTQAQTASSDDATEVNLSPGGKLLSDLPPIILDPKVHMANAEKRLNELMAEMGIPSNTDIDIHVSSSGRITVKGDNEKLAELEKMLNDGSEMDLRNSLIGAHTSATIQRIAAASQKTQAKVDANPTVTEMLWNQMLAEAKRISNQSMDFSFSSGTLDGVFADATTVSVA